MSAFARLAHRLADLGPFDSLVIVIGLTGVLFPD
jgi:hypothetical protein